MPHRALPPLNALRAFEAAARHMSFARAAEELNVTAAALSHQIKSLEGFLDTQLFVRKTRSVALTDTGKALYPGLHASFGQIRQAIANLDNVRASNVLVISSPPGFTAKWLAPRLFRFLTTHPEIDARISSIQTRANFTTDGVDVAIRNSLGTPEALYSEKLAELHWVVVASPEYIEAAGPFETPEQLATATLIHDDSLGGIDGIPVWSDWFHTAGIDEPASARRLRFSSTDHSIDAAEEGAGVFLAPDLIVTDDLRRGRLVRLFPDRRVGSQRAMYFVCPEGTENVPKIAAFRSWLQAEIHLADQEPASRIPNKAPAVAG